MKSIVDHTLYQTWVSLNQQHFPSSASEGLKDRVLYTHALKNMFGRASTVLQLLNHANQSFEFLSENIQSMLGYELDTFTSGKIQFKMSLMHPEHARIFIKHILPTVIDLKQQYKKTNQLKELNFFFTYQIRRNDGHYIWVSEKMNIVEVDDLGNALLSLTLIDNITLTKSHDAPIDFIVHLNNDQYYPEPIVRIHYSVNSKSCLSDRELDVLRLLSEGKSSHEIAVQLNISYHTVCTHRKNMLQKTNCKNLMALLTKMKYKQMSVA